MLDAATLTRLATRPIPGELPTGGENRMQSQDYVRLDAAMLAMQSVAGGEVDWRQATADAVAILERQGKDLQVASWLARCLFQTDRLAGLAAGLGLVRELMATWWKDLHPPRARGRRSVLEWLGDRIIPLLGPADARAAGDLAACIAAIDAIGGVVGDRFDGGDSGLLRLRRSLVELAATSPAATGTAPAAPAPAQAMDATPSATMPGEAAVRSAAVAPAGCAPSDREAALARLGEVAAFFARTEPHSPIGPLLARALAWAGMSFQQVFEELLREKKDAQKLLFDTLGVKGEDRK